VHTSNTHTGIELKILTLVGAVNEIIRIAYWQYHDMHTSFSSSSLNKFSITIRFHAVGEGDLPRHEFDMGGDPPPPHQHQLGIVWEIFSGLELSILRCQKLIRGLFPL
jgi:hypothetical protein